MGPKQCQVCDEAKSKYKCPSCLIAYCSLVCYKKHKETPCAKPIYPDKKPTIPESIEEKPIYVDESVEVMQKVQLESVAASSEIRDALRNEDLRKLIYNIDSSENPEEELNEAMGLDVFRIFSDKVLAAANPRWGMQCSN